MSRHPGGRAPDPSRITHALNARQLYGPQVDAACLAAEPDVDEWEAGRRYPSPAQVEALAALTAYPLEWFYRGPLPVAAFLCGRGRGKSARLTRDPDPPPGCPEVA